MFIYVRAWVWGVPSRIHRGAAPSPPFRTTRSPGPPPIDSSPVDVAYGSISDIDR